MKRQAGFTLVEVMVAVGLFAMLGYGCYKVVHGLSLARDTLTRQAEEVRRFSRVINQLNLDFSQLTPRKVFDDSQKNLPALDTHGPYLVEFTRTGVPNPLMVKRANVVRIAYHCSEETNARDFHLDDEKSPAYATLREQIGDGKRGYLLRYVWPVLDRGKEADPQVQLLMAGVDECAIEYMDEKKHWDDEWPVLGAPSNNAATELPYAIRIKLTIHPYGKLEHWFQVRNLPAERS